MLKLLPHLGRATRYMLLSGLIAGALGLSVIRFWLIPRAAEYRAWLTGEIGAQLGAPVQIGVLAAGMRGLEPVVVLKDFDLLDPVSGRPALSFERVRVRLDLPRTLLTGQPVWRSLSMEGARMVLVRDAAGRFGLQGVAEGEGRPDWLLAQGRIELLDIEMGWRDERAGNTTRWLGRGELRLDNAGDRHGLNVRLDLPEALGRKLTVAAVVRGSPERPDALEARFYLEGKGLRPGALEWPVDFPWSIRGGTADIALWGDWRAGGLSRVAGQLSALKTVLTHRADAGGTHSLGLSKLQGAWSWQLTETGWRAHFNRVLLAPFDQPTSPFDLALAYESTEPGGAPLLRAAVSRVPLDDLRLVSDALPVLGEDVQTRVRELAPRGELRDVRLVYAVSDPGRNWALCTGFIRFGVNAVDGLPGGRGLSGSFCGSDRIGRVRLAMRDGELSFAALWPKSLRIDELDGELDWRQDEEEWSLSGKALKLSAPGLNLAGRFQLDWPKDQSRSPFLDARGGLRDVEASAIRGYLPVAVMSRLSAGWLTEALDAGRVPRADLLFHGFLRDFPFTHGEGVFQASAQAEGIELDFNPDWPHLYDVYGRVEFRGRGMVIDAESGRIGEGRIRSAHAEVDDLVREDWLAIHGEVETTVPQAMQFLSKTPLRHIPERLLKVAEPAGATTISLDFQVPISEGITEVKVDGKARLHDAALGFSALGQRLSRIQGDLGFSNEGLEAQGIRALLLDEPVEITVDQRGGDILVGASGRAGVTALAKAFPSPAWKRAEGQASYRLALAIPETMEASTHPLRMQLSSDLYGFGLDLPAPLGKTVNSKQDFRLDLVFRQTEKSSLRLAYGTELKAQFTLADRPKGLQLSAGDIALGAALPIPGGADSLRFYADLPELDLDAWAAVFTGWEAENKSSSAVALDTVDISIDRCSWGERDLGPLDLRGSKSDDIWRGTLDTAYGKGRFQLNVPEFQPAKLTLDLDTLKWPKLAAPLRQSEGADLDPARLPALKVRSRQTLWQGSALGQLELDAERWTQGLNISALNLLAENHQLKLTGHWMKSDAGVETSLVGSLDVKDMGRLVEELGYGKEIRDTPAHARFSLKWPGGPQRFSAARVAGNIDMKLGKGGLLQVEPGLGRVIGMLNLSTLSRRLRLDFSDMFGKGLAYDSVAGRFALEDGQAKTESFLIEAVAANIFVSGRAGLVAKDLDMQIAVVPHTSVALPIAGTLAGGPAVGAAVLLAQRLVGDEVDSITASHYLVSGTWENPKVSNQPGYMPMDMINRAWSGLKQLSGFEEQEGAQ